MRIKSQTIINLLCGYQEIENFMGFLTVVFFVLPVSQAPAKKTIVLDCPLSTAFLYGWDAERNFNLAVDEINAKRGVNVGGTKQMFKVGVISTPVIWNPVCPSVRPSWRWRS